MAQLSFDLCADETNLSQNLVNVQVLLNHSIGKLVKLVDEIAYIDTAHRVSLRERHSLREALPGKSARS